MTQFDILTSRYIFFGRKHRAQLLPCKPPNWNKCWHSLGTIVIQLNKGQPWKATLPGWVCRKLNNHAYLLWPWAAANLSSHPGNLLRNLRILSLCPTKLFFQNFQPSYTTKLFPNSLTEPLTVLWRLCSVHPLTNSSIFLCFFFFFKLRAIEDGCFHHPIISSPSLLASSTLAHKSPWPTRSILVT